MSAGNTFQHTVSRQEDSHGTMKIENTEKRDTLQSTEKKYQKLWTEEKVFESDAPSCEEYPLDSNTPEELRSKFPKFFGTMAYPYVNGAPHLGHAFTVSKIELTARVARAQGKRSLYPQGYHATGMPIRACADKLANEIKMFGADFSGYKESEHVETEQEALRRDTQSKVDFTKYSNVTKSKAALKTVKSKYQFQVMLALGVPQADIHKFADAQHWLRFFPQLWQLHLTKLGCAIDWRRSFITTDINPYYDSFVQWQMRRLKALGKIEFGKRFTVYSPKDGQPCLDHDRSSGEGIQVQEYVGVKCRVQQWSEPARRALNGKIPHGANVYMVAATLRPETMYGQTNLFVSPKITYGLFHVADNDYFFIGNRSARNMAYQGTFPEWGKFPRVAELSGSDVVGSLVEAPLSFRKHVYVVPMDTIKESKGTGVVTSVPSDSPDDYAMTVELTKKARFYGVQPEWVSMDILPIIETPGYGNMIAPTLVKQMKINSPRDATRLAEAKEKAYKVGFYQGKMVHGEFSGQPVQQAKALVQKSLLQANDAIIYCEPDGVVISRSDDECVAAYLDQWFLTYGDGDDDWRNDVLSHIRGDDGQGFNAFTTSTKNAIEQTLGWLNQWSVTRQYGLGTKLPWDPSELVEGLSDSTIYMAYYTIAHYLHSDIYGQQQGLGGFDAEQISDDVWDYVFAIKNEVNSAIPKAVLDAMRREFTYWYPLDIRVSGKDLISNHLIFFLYIHQAIWGKVAPQYLPKAIRLNGHVTLNGVKMSKSTGNFLTLNAAIDKFGADATRVALADGGDGVEDANFEETVANSIILKLFELRKWTEDVILEVRLLKEGESYHDVREVERTRNSDVIQRSGAKLFWDKLFEAEINALVQMTVQHFKDLNFKAALKSGYYDLTSARDTYRLSTASASIGMHQQCVHKYVELQSLMICVIAPHWADYVWREVLKKPSTIQNEVFPQVADPEQPLIAASKYIRSVSAAVGAAEGAQQRRFARGKGVQYDPKQSKRLTIFVADSWPVWQLKCADIVRELFDGTNLNIEEVSKRVDKSDMKKSMAFIHKIKKQLDSGVSIDAVFEGDLDFNETQILQEMIPGLKSTVPKLAEVHIIVVGGNSGHFDQLPQTAAAAEPGLPSFEFKNI